MKKEKTSTGNILIIDDKRENLRLLDTLLTRAGYTVRPASDGPLGLLTAQKKLPDLILLDIRMPDMDGYEVCKALKADERTRDIPVIFISALHETTDKVKGLTLSAVDYITKPFQEAEVLARVEKHLTIRNLHKQLETQNAQLQQEIAERKRAEEELLETRAVLQTAMDQSPAGIAIADALDCKLRYVNDTGLGILGKAREEIVDGIGIEQYVASWQILHFDGTPYKDDEVPLARAIMYGEVCSKEFIVRRPDDEDRIVLANAAPIFDKKGEISAGIVVFLDITERKQMEEALRKSEEEKKLILNTANEIIAYHDTDHNLKWANKYYLDSLGKTLDEVVGKKCYHNWGLDRVCMKCPVTKAMETGMPRQDELTPDNQHHWPADQGSWAINAAPVQDAAGNIVGAIEIARNITERKQAEEELKKAKDAADAANRAKSAFLANMSHELRTPLSAIMGFSQLLGHSTNLDHEEQKNLAIIRSSGEHLLNLINDVLDMSKIEAGRTVLYVEDFDMYHLLDNVEAMFILKAEEKNLQLVVERDSGVPRYVHTDEGKLRQVLVNLLGNAIKFTKQGGVSVRVRATLVEGGQPQGIAPTCLRFEISDTGPGIAPDEMSGIFDAFTQTQTGRQSQEGTGLGLPISRKFVQMMGGDITVASEVGKGTVFRFEIQAEAVDSAALETESPERYVIALEPDQPRFRILIADDIESNRLLLLNMLALPGFEIRNAKNGEEALEIREEWEPHLILMDIRMPVMDGYEATRRIRNAESEMRAEKSETAASHSIPHCKIVAMTANAYEDERVAALSAGCDDFVRKPIKESVIFDVIRRHIGVRYVYAEDATAPVQETSEKDKLKALTPEALGALPQELLTELEEASVLGSADKVKHLIKNIRSHNTALADALVVLNAGYSFDIILESIEKSVNTDKRGI